MCPPKNKFYKIYKTYKTYKTYKIYKIYKTYKIHHQGKNKRLHPKRVQPQCFKKGTRPILFDHNFSSFTIAVAHYNQTLRRFVNLLTLKVIVADDFGFLIAGGYTVNA